MNILSWLFTEKTEILTRQEKARIRVHCDYHIAKRGMEVTYSARNSLIRDVTYILEKKALSNDEREKYITHVLGKVEEYLDFEIAKAPPRQGYLI